MEGYVISSSAPTDEPGCVSCRIRFGGGMVYKSRPRHLLPFVL